MDGVKVYENDSIADSQVATAKKYPRNEPACIKAAINTVSSSNEIAQERKV